MEESVPPTSSSENLPSALQGSSQAPSVTLPSESFAAKPSPGEMEFAQMPLHHHYDAYGPSATMFDMSNLSSNLPHYNHPQYGTHFIPQVTQAGTMQSNLAFPNVQNQQWISQVTNQYAQQYLPNMQSAFPGYDVNMANANAGMHARGHLMQQQQQQQQQQQHQQVPYTFNMVPQQHYQNYHPSQHNPYAPSQITHYEQRPNLSYQTARSPIETRNPPPALPSGTITDSRRDSSTSTLQISTTLRGPPRKAKQSGHALWVGNLPPGTNIVDLKDHLSRDATEDIQSVFLISKTNCAFVNYKTAESCAAAMMRFHDSRFRQMRLVCRLRRGSSPGSATDSTQNELKENVQSPNSNVELAGIPQSTPSEDVVSGGLQRTAERLVKEKFFIIKSLTREDVDRAVASGTWATQAQNEENLNLAYATAENVYLIFSVNKSSEYYGYARMESPISGDILAVPEVVQQQQQPPVVASSSDDGPTIIPTPATATAPRGYIVDDSARGNIFWEADTEASVSTASSVGAPLTPGETSGDENTSDPAPQPSNVGRPFKISWKSTEKLPFIRTRGLRNPWNSNREIKIARDGTEVEPTVGRRLISMFEQQAHMNAAAMRQSNMAISPQPVTYPGMIPHGYVYGSPSAPSYGRPY